MTLCEEAVDNFKKRYSGLHPLVVQRSIERAKDAFELFEILESIPKNPPFSWSEEKRSWVKDFDVSAKNLMKKMNSSR